MQTINDLFSKIAPSVIYLLVFSVIGGFIFFGLIKHFILKYFEGLDTKIVTAFKRIDELRGEFRDFRMTDFRDYKKDISDELSLQQKNIKELYNRTDSHEEVKECIAFCDKRHKGIDYDSHK